MISLIFYLLGAGAILSFLVEAINYDFGNGDLLVNVFIAVSAVIILIKILIQKDRENGIKYFNTFLALSFVTRILFMYLDRYFRHIYTFPNSGLDTGSFHEWALIFLGSAFTDGSGYGAVLGWIYGIYYPNPLWGQYINVLASILTILVVYKILCKLNISQTFKTIGILLVCFMPNYLIMSSILLRESFITLLLALAIYFLLEWWQKDHWKYILYATLASLGATYLHSGTIAYAVAIFIVVAFANNKKRQFTFKPTTIFITAVGVTFFMFLYNNYGETFFGYVEGLESVEDVIEKSGVYSTGGSAYSVSLVDDNSTLGFLINSPIRLFYFLASPLPWDWRGITDIIAFFGSGLFYLVSIFYGIRALMLKNNPNRNLIIIFIIFIISSGLIYSWGVSNAGTALRHRDKFLISFTLLLMLSCDAIRKSKVQKVQSIKRLSTLRTE